MRKKTRKGIKIGIPHLAEGWYEEEIEGIRKDIKGRSRKSLFKRSKDNDYLKKKFVDLLMVAERDIEQYLWHTKGFGVRNELGKEIDYEFHSLFSLLINIFNKISLNFEPKDISEDLLNHLKRELEILQKQASHLWNVQSCNSTPQGKEKAKKIIETFRRKLWDFRERMEPYLKQEESKEGL